MNVLRRALAPIGILVVALAIAACGDDGERATQTVIVERTVTEPAPAAVVPEARLPRSPRTRLVDYTAADFSARVPAGWEIEEGGVDHGGYVRSSWFDPANPAITVLFDISPGESTPAAEKAQAVMALTSGSTGYRQLTAGPAAVAGLDGYRWTFAVDGTLRVDYFINDCDTGVAVLGTAPPRRFRKLASTFARVADSVRIDCAPVEEPVPATPPEPEPEPEPAPASCHPSYEGACLDPSMGDYDCDGGSGDGPGYTGPVTVVGSDDYDLDRDGDGSGCDQ